MCEQWFYGSSWTARPFVVSQIFPAILCCWGAGGETTTECQQPYPAHEHGVRPGVLLDHEKLVPDPASLGALQHLPLLALLVVPVERGSQVAPPLGAEGLAVAQHAQAHQGGL